MDAILIVKRFSELSAAEIYEILKARFEVFVMEQRCFYLDMDDIDYRSIHLWMAEDKHVVAYARLFEEADKETWHIGRVLTTLRRQGLGSRIMQAAIDQARQNGASAINIEAQSHAVRFYERLGFQVCSDEFEDAGIPHVMMRLEF